MKSNQQKIPVLVWGASSQAEVVTDILISSKIYQIDAYIDDINRGKTDLHGVPVLSSIDQAKERYLRGTKHAIVAIGDIQTRKKMVSILEGLHFTFINAIHKSAVIASNANLGINCIIKPGAIIDPLVNIGNHSYVGSGVTIGHHVTIGNYVNITGGSRLAGHVSVGDEVFIGTGTSIKDRITIGDRAVIGVGSVVVSDIPSDTIAVGVPAKTLS